MSDENHTQSSGVKIQINSLKALERLIGGDSELEIELRNNIARQFTDKHFKPILEGEVILQVVQKIKAEINKKVGEIAEKDIVNYGVDGWGRAVISSLKPEVQSMIRLSVSNAIREIVITQVDEYLKSTQLANQVKTYVNTYAYAEIQSQVKAKIKEAIGG